MNGMERWWNETEVLWESLPITTLSTTNPTRTHLGLNPGLHSERLVTNHQSHGMAHRNSNECHLSYETLHIKSYFKTGQAAFMWTSKNPLLRVK